MKTTFAAVANGVVYGVGDSKEAAQEDAANFTDEESVYELDYLPCTAEAFRYIVDYGFKRGEVVVERSLVRLASEVA